MRAATAILTRDEAEGLSAKGRLRVTNELVLLDKLSRSTKPDAVVGSAIEEAVLAIRKELRRDARPAR